MSFLLGANSQFPFAGNVRISPSFLIVFKKRFSRARSVWDRSSLFPLPQTSFVAPAQINFFVLNSSTLLISRIKVPSTHRVLALYCVLGVSRTARGLRSSDRLCSDRLRFLEKLLVNPAESTANFLRGLSADSARSFLPRKSGK